MTIAASAADAADQAMLGHGLLHGREVEHLVAGSRRVIVYAISTLVHNLPMVLLKDDSPNADHEATFSDLLARADTLGIGGWLRTVSEQKG